HPRHSAELAPLRQWLDAIAASPEDQVLRLSPSFRRTGDALALDVDASSARVLDDPEDDARARRASKDDPGRVDIRKELADVIDVPAARTLREHGRHV